MKNALRTTLAAALAAVALAVTAPSAVAAPTGGPEPACYGIPRPAAAPAPRVAANPSTISAGKYNQARKILERAGSYNASKSHLVHGISSVPVWYGTRLLSCSRDEFRQRDRNVAIKKSGMSEAHWTAIHNAARVMGISRW
ncbi:hypothetical protein [Streptomyces candidus]|uniref:Uncharacterized protein n=1 Tax=Streptomyces candidus TaxID=67283 RepID=A0A7X0LSE5_9ACTN|nr:hypothetical protein [Streptomyces candidus]MBB6439603.1 hypothetical protein [Streptomyces candidus]GHH56435.1 hypothetical protein GCM10018773_62440 [Streptomyces candidus]